VALGELVSTGGAGLSHSDGAEPGVWGLVDNVVGCCAHAANDRAVGVQQPALP